MGCAYFIYLTTLLAASTIILGIQEHPTIQYTFTNNAIQTSGAHRFETKIGENYAKSMMKIATRHIWTIFGEYKSPDSREHVNQIHLFIDEMEEASTSQTKNGIGEIHISANHIASCKDEHLTDDVFNIIYYELTHILQSKGGGQIPLALKNGIAAYVVLHLSEVEPVGWVKFGEGDKWDQSYDVTAQFLKFCCDLNPNFVCTLNAKMKHSYDDKYFVELTGKTISAAWKEYKDKWGNHA